MKKYDIAFVGIAKHFNYGSVLTNFSTYYTAKDYGKNVCIITHPKSSVQQPHEDIFEELPYSETDIFTAKNKNEMRSFNELSDIFCVTSDQLFNQNSYNWFDKFMLLDWVWDFKKKCTYAASFGHDKLLEHTTDWTRAEMSYFMKKFDIFTVREESGVLLATNQFGVNAEWVLDPVFLCNPQHFINFAGQHNIEQNIFAYTLDANVKDVLEDVSSTFKLPLHHFNDYEKDLNFGKKTKSVESWLRSLIKSKFVITDSFHGVCFALIFKKDFIVFSNHIRGITRFKSILKLAGLEHRMVESIQEYYERKDKLLEQIDYGDVYQKLKPMIEKSRIFFENIIMPLETEKSLSEYDLICQCQFQSQRCKNISLTKFIKYKFLSKITFGKMHKHYKRKYKELKKQINSGRR